MREYLSEKGLLDPVHHQGSRWGLSAHLLPKVSKWKHMNSPYPLAVWNCLNYVLELKSLPENKTYSCVFEPQNTKRFEESESKIPFLGIRILAHLKKSKINLNLIGDVPLLDIAPWTLSAPIVRFDLTKFKKDTTNQETVLFTVYYWISSVLFLFLFLNSQTVRKQRQ